jgi:hypothetical protein
MQLLLARAGDHRPALEEGLARKSTEEAPRPRSLPGRVEVLMLDSPDAAPNDLAAQRWGVVAPEGSAGDAMLEAIQPLLELRKREQDDAPVIIYRAPQDRSAEGAVKWRGDTHQATAVSEEERPKYLLLLGGLEDISLEFQQVMAHTTYVGRLHVSQPDGKPDLAGYAAYARKVLAHEQRDARDAAADMLLYTAHDQTNATKLGHVLLMTPCLKDIEAQWKKKRPLLTVGEVPFDGGNPAALLQRAGAARSGVLLSMAHGLGRPDGDWSSREEQRAMQGALSLGEGKALTAQDLRNTPFLPGGMWFNVSCFGAATPSESAFHEWLSMLEKQNAYQKPASEVLHHLPRQGESPFLAALPQTLLANPRGPLAVIGHSDLSWTLGFTDVDDPGRSRHERILSALRVLANGSRAGVALDTLMRAYREVNDRVLKQYEAREKASLRNAADPTDPVRLGLLWMLRNELRGYLLLGDPAARLALG